jgi:murein DD-endopeptidase MepM/ murein hydrolase activator NlpD
MRAVLLRNETPLGRGGQFFDLGETSRRGPVQIAVMAVPSTAGAGKAQLRVEQGGRVLVTLELVIEERQFLTETFPITGAMAAILTPDPEKTRQAEQLWAVLARTGNDIYTLGEFIMPVKSTVQTSRFGSRRVYRYPDGRTSTSIHAGVDWRAPTGTPISACAPGKVVLARMRIVTGNTVVIEHMPGVYSLYYHMDRIDVAEGDMVQTGTRLGDAGATGFATGAHLHWELRVATENTDPASLLGRRLLDKDAILRILNE